MSDRPVRRKITLKTDAMFLQDLGRRLRVIRRTRGLTQKEFSELLGLSREGYANYELGKREMGITVARDIREKMKIDQLAPNSEADRLVPVPAVAPMRPGWVRSLSLYRAKIIAAREAFELERFSSFRRRLHSVRDTVFVSSTITVWLRLEVPDFALHRMDATTQIDWALLLSFLIAAVLLPFQGLYMGRFIFWMRTSSRV